MKIYIVEAGWDYEGLDVQGGKAFRSREEAQKYADSLQEEVNGYCAGYDTCRVTELELV